MILVRSRARAAILLAGLLLPAGVPGILGVHACPNHGHGTPGEETVAESASSPAAAAGAEHAHHSVADPGSAGHGGHGGGTPSDSDSSSGASSCDGLCELLCLGAGHLADPRTFASATIAELAPSSLVVALRPERAAPIRATQRPFVLPPSHAPPSA